MNGAFVDDTNGGRVGELYDGRNDCTNGANGAKVLEMMGANVDDILNGGRVGEIIGAGVDDG